MRYFGAVTIDREVASLMREAKTWLKVRGHEERRARRGTGEMASIDGDSR
jgi:hypothetical protein